MSHRSCLFYLWSFFCAFVFSVSTPAAHGAKHKDSIRVQIGGEPSTLDPWRAVDVYAFSILANVMEGLYKADSNGELTTGLAASHTLSKDELEHRFRLRENARWSDGVPVQIEDFVFGFQHVLNPKTAAPNAETFFPIVNARAVFSGKKPVSELGVSKEGNELVIRLEKPNPLLLLDLTLPAASPLRKDLFLTAKSRWSTNFPVTGRYKIETYKPSDEVVLVPNEKSSAPGKKPILIKILSEEITAMNLFESGRMDIISTVTISEIDRLKKQGLVKVVPATTTFFLSFNVSRAPFNDLSWRKAVASSFDREGMVRALNGSYDPVTSVIAKPIDGTLPYKPMKDAEAIAKIRAIPKKPRLKFAYGSSGLTKIIAEKIQADLDANLGLKIELEPMELKTLLGRLQSDPPDLYFLGMSAFFDDGFSQLNGFSNAVTPNFSRYKSDEFEKKMAEFRVAPVGPKRKAAAEDCNRLLTEKDVVSVPLLLRKQVYGVSKSIKGFHLSPYQIIDYGNLSKN
jgi:ABC-type oligopeptide transport system substrate-binding subunit